MFVVFIIIAIIQLAIPASIVFRGEKIIANGREYKFKTAPVDPNDPFRGKYIALRFEANHYKLYDSITWEKDKPVYVSLKNDMDGFAEISYISEDKPNEGVDYIIAKVEWSDAERYSTLVYVQYPFNRYYMEESKSLKAEQIYRESLSDTTKNTYALVTIKQGSAVLKDVMINDTPLKDLIK